MKLKLLVLTSSRVSWVRLRLLLFKLMNMLNTGKVVFASLLLLCASSVMAQEPLDGAYIKTTTKEKDVIPYDYIREADVFWAKRIWRMIDVREKQNLPFKYPQLPLIQILHTAAKN